MVSWRALLPGIVVAVVAGGCCQPRARCVPCPAPPAPVAVMPPLPPSEPPVAAEREAAPKDPVIENLESKRLKGLMWDEVSLDQALTYLRTITGVEFTVSPRAREEKLDDVVISAQLDDVSVYDVLSYVLTEPFDMRWEVRDGVVHVMVSDELEGPLRLRYYDVKDLIAPEAQGGYRTLEHLVDDVRDLHARYWDRDDAAIEGRHGIVIARASRAVHEGIERLLASRRAVMKGKTLDAAMRARLERVTVSLAMADTTVGEVVKVLQIQSGFNLMIDSRIANEVANAPVTGLKLEDTPLLTALAMLASAAGEHAVWTNLGNVLVLTHREFARGYS